MSAAVGCWVSAVMDGMIKVSARSRGRMLVCTLVERE
jgi:hypothetical protein